MPELMAIIEASRDRIDAEHRFQASIHNVQLEDETKTDPWEDLKARVFSGGQARDSKDIMAFQGITAKQKGFGIGNGLGYTNGDSVEWWKK